MDADVQCHPEEQVRGGRNGGEERSHREAEGDVELAAGTPTDDRQRGGQEEARKRGYEFLCLVPPG